VNVNPLTRSPSRNPQCLKFSAIAKQIISVPARHKRVPRPHFFHCVSTSSTLASNDTFERDSATASWSNSGDNQHLQSETETLLNEIGELKNGWQWSAKQNWQEKLNYDGRCVITSPICGAENKQSASLCWKIRNIGMNKWLTGKLKCTMKTTLCYNSAPTPPPPLYYHKHSIIWWPWLYNTSWWSDKHGLKVTNKYTNQIHLLISQTNVNQIIHTYRQCR
jgi:hypothetical protein